MKITKKYLSGIFSKHQKANLISDSRELDKFEFAEILFSNSKISRRSLDVTIERSDYFVDIHITNSKVLFFSFEFGGFDKKGALNREAWGGGYFRYKDISYVGVKPKWNNWYLSPPLDLIIEELKPIIEMYESVITYGSSMGGFAALTYANLLSASKVIAFCPQSSRLPENCPWENPSRDELKKLHSESIYADAVGNYSKARDVFIFADLHNERDRLHAHRLEAGNVSIINTPFIGHSIPSYLNALGIFTDIPISIIEDRFNALDFSKKMRARRDLKRYFSIMKYKATGSKKRLYIVETHMKKSKLVGPP